MCLGMDMCGRSSWLWSGTGYTFACTHVWEVTSTDRHLVQEHLSTPAGRAHREGHGNHAAKGVQAHMAQPPSRACV